MRFALLAHPLKRNRLTAKNRSVSKYVQESLIGNSSIYGNTTDVVPSSGLAESDYFASSIIRSVNHSDNVAAAND